MIERDPTWPEISFSDRMSSTEFKVHDKAHIVVDGKVQSVSGRGNGLISSVVLTVVSPSVWEATLGNPPGSALFPYSSPALFSMTIGFVGIWLFSVTDNSKRAAVDRDGFSAIKAELPSPTRRAALLMDPSYEIKTDYGKVLTALREALERAADTVVMIWYPQLQLLESSQLAARLKGSADASATNTAKEATSRAPETGLPFKSWTVTWILP